MLKLPPYAKKLQKRFATDWRPPSGTVFIAAGDDPASFDWSIVAGFDVVVFVFGAIIDNVPERLAVLLLRAGATPALVCYDDPAIAPPSGIVSYRQQRTAA